MFIKYFSQFSYTFPLIYITFDFSSKGIVYIMDFFCGLCCYFFHFFIGGAFIKKIYVFFDQILFSFFNQHGDFFIF